MHIEPNFNPDLLVEEVEYNFDIIAEGKTVANGYFYFLGIDLTYVLMHYDLDCMEEVYDYVGDYMTCIVESINE